MSGVCHRFGGKMMVINVAEMLKLYVINSAAINVNIN